MTRVVFPVYAWPKLKAGLEFLVAEPRRFDMRWYNEPWDFLDRWEKGVHTRRVGGAPPCGTVLCLAGAITVADALADPDDQPKIREIDVSDTIALDVLGIDWTYDQRKWDSTRQRDVFTDRVADALSAIFQDTKGIKTLPDLWAALDAAFVFPEPLPALPVVTP